MTYETYIGGKKIEEITPEIKHEITQMFIEAFNLQVVEEDSNKKK
jgi:hypothetical protein